MRIDTGGDVDFDGVREIDMTEGFSRYLCSNDEDGEFIGNE